MDCEYCMDEKKMVARCDRLIKNSFLIVGSALTYRVYNGDGNGYLEDNCFIRFCPMCGRELEAHP